jgi:hypothetical protein
MQITIWEAVPSKVGSKALNRLIVPDAAWVGAMNAADLLWTLDVSPSWVEESGARVSSMFTLDVRFVLSYFGGPSDGWSRWLSLMCPL